ncbi:MAG TPA: mechanosensitive ion channel family protein [Acidimicrobiales bacterium]|nr:mechanosensitive ion channel family protein [Acidimicrobiales bacterium]
MPDFIADYDWSGFTGRSAKIVLVLVLALVFLRLGTRLVDRSLRSIGARSPLRESSPRLEQRAETLAGVAKSVVRIVVWTVAVLLVLEEFGLNLGPLLAGASIVGVAVGFGAQSLVKDFFSGFFILVEDQYAVGDVITIADQTGTVEEINLRVTRIRAADGTVWFVPNGEIRKVGNSAKEWSRSIVDVLIPNKADLAAATAVIAEEAAALASEEVWSECVLEEPQVLGVESLGAENVTVRVSTKTTPAHRAPFARAMRSRISGRLQREGLVATEPASKRPLSES